MVTLVNHRPWHHHWNTRRCKLGALGCGIWHRSSWWWSPCWHGDQASLGSAHEVLKDLSFKILKYTFSFYFTTYYVKCYGVGLRGLCWNLTLIYTSISFLYKNFKSWIFGFKVVIEFATHLYIFNQQNPLILWIMFCRKSLIRCKSLLPGC